MPKNERPNVRRAEVTFPPELLDRIEELAGAGGRNAWIVGACAAAAGVKLAPEVIAPPVGRPKAEGLPPKSKRRRTR